MAGVQLLFQIALFLGDLGTQVIGGGFGVEPVVGNTLFLAKLPARGQIAPQERGEAHYRQIQHTQDHGLNGVTEFVDYHPGIILVAQEQEHTQAHTAGAAPMGDDAATVGTAGFVLVVEHQQ